jgi:nitrogen regulatory protein P-II 1
MNMILFVLHDSEKLKQVLEAWTEAGISGATVLFSTGMGRLQQNQSLRDDLPLMPSLEDFLPKVNSLSRTIFSIVDDDAVIAKVITATERVVGDLYQPNRGVLIVLPVSQVYGLRQHNRAK